VLQLILKALDFKKQPLRTSEASLEALTKALHGKIKLPHYVGWVRASVVEKRWNINVREREREINYPHLAETTNLGQ
jgi:hypothetical protein